MKLTPAKLLSSVQGAVTGPRAVLLFGPDQGVIEDSATQLLDKWIEDKSDPFALAHIDYSKLKEDPALLSDELASISMLGGIRVVKVTGAPATISAAVKDIITALPGENRLLVISGDCPPSSSLRKLFEQQDKLVAVGCYKEELGAIKQFIRAELEATGLRYEAQVVDAIAFFVDHHRLQIRKEIEKLALYVAKRGEITVPDVEQLLAYSQELETQQLVDAIAARNPAQALSYYQHMTQSGVAPIAILRSAAYYFTRLHQVQSQVALGESTKQAMAQLSPPVFFKQVARFEQHLSAWSLSYLGKVLSIILKAEKQCKSSEFNAHLTTGHMVMALCKMAG